jgi:hypothetical protein
MRPPQWGQVSTGRPRVRRISSAHGQYRQRAPVRPGLGGGLVCAWGAAGVSVGAGSGGGMTSGHQGLAGASTPPRADREVRAATAWPRRAGEVVVVASVVAGWAHQATAARVCPIPVSVFLHAGHYEASHARCRGTTEKRCLPTSPAGTADPSPSGARAPAHPLRGRGAWLRGCKLARLRARRP